MEKTAQQTAASSEETASAMEELAGQAREMKTTVGRFKLDAGASAAPKLPPPAHSLEKGAAAHLSR